MTARHALLAIDIGTSKCRATLFSESAELLADASRPTQVEVPTDGDVILDPERLWLDIAALVREVRPHADRILGVGVAAQLGMVVLDVRRAPLAPAMLWADRRAADEALELKPVSGAQSLAIAGRPLTPELVGPRMRWLRKHRPGVTSAVRHIVSLKDFVILRLTGAVLTDETHASYTGLFDVAARRWSPDLCRLQDVSMDILPEVRSAGSAAGTVSDAAAEATLLAPGTPVAVGASDGTLGTLGAGAVRAGLTVDVAGTTDVLLHIASSPQRAPGDAAIVNAHAVANLWSIGGPTGMTGGAVSWMAAILGHPSVGEALNAMPHALDDVTSSATPPFFYPSLSGSRFPDWRPADQGVLLGLSLDHGPGALLRAAMEGAAFVLRRGLSVLQAAGIAVDEIIVVGGLAQHPGTLQLRADILNVPLRIAANSEASSVGAAMTAGLVGGSFRNADEAAAAMVRYIGIMRPEGRRAAIYADRFESWSRGLAL